MNVRTNYTTVAMWPTVRIFYCICKLGTNCEGRLVTLTSIRDFIYFVIHVALYIILLLFFSFWSWFCPLPIFFIHQFGFLWIEGALIVSKHFLIKIIIIIIIIVKSVTRFNYI